MNNGNSTVFLLNFNSALEANRADSSQDHSPRSSHQSEGSSDQADGKRQIQNDCVVFANANTTYVPFRNKCFNLTHEIVCELLKVLIGERSLRSSQTIS